MIESERSPEHLGSLQATVDYQNADGPSGNMVGQVRVAPRPALGGQTGEAIQVLLQRRLRMALLIAAVVLALSVLLYLLNIALRHGPLPRIVWPSLALCGAGSLVAATLAVRLARKGPLPLRQLRAIELVLVGLSVVLCVWKQSSYLEGALFFTQFRGADRLPVLAGYHSLPWFALLTTYGLFVPNTWRRCAAVVGVIVLCPFAVLAADTTQPEWPLQSRTLVPYLTVLGAWMAFGAGLAVFGCHHITALRREATEARRLGQYQLTKRLGAGGMGEVYLGEHLLLRRPCAIKLIRPERAGDPNNLLRFEREVQATAALTHPNTVQVFDYGHAEDGTFYYVMEYLVGRTLEQIVGRHGPLPPARAVHLLRQVCGALREAHAVGLIHRDIKPSNVMVCERGGVHDVAKLLDFGLVIAPDASEDAGRLTQDGAITGTPAYMSPEQADSTASLDARSDVYSVGAVAYFLLTGQSPFAGRSPLNMLAAHLYESPAPLTQHCPDVPADLQAVVLRCLLKNPAERFPDAESLELVLAGCHPGHQWSEKEAADWWRSQAGPNGNLDSQRVNEERGLTKRCS